MRSHLLACLPPRLESPHLSGRPPRLRGETRGAEGARRSHREQFHPSKMETNQALEFGVEQKSGPEITQKPVETHMNLEEQTDEMPESEFNRKFVEMCLDTAVETDINPEKQADPEARSEVTQKPVETCQDTVVEADANPEKQADLEARLEVNEEPVETCQDTVVEADANPEKQADLEARLEVNEEPVETCQDTVVEADANPEKQAYLEARLEVNEEPVETCQDTVVEADANPEKLAANPGVIYRCKRCRRMVATQEYVVTHKVGLGERCFLRRKSYHVDDKEPKCTCIFVEPMKWMQAVEEGYISNKLWCMGCKTRLGSFNWAGMQCSCGAWVIPAFQLLKSRIDESQM